MFFFINSIADTKKKTRHKASEINRGHSFELLVYVQTQDNVNSYI